MDDCISLSASSNREALSVLLVDDVGSDAAALTSASSSVVVHATG
jgi:hypothetical protein